MIILPCQHHIYRYIIRQLTNIRCYYEYTIYKTNKREWKNARH